MLTLVPARGGSKRLPRKNVRLLSGVPLLLWTLIPFQHLRPVVSSDDAAILALAREHGFQTIERPAALATDSASSVDVAMHALEQRGEDCVLLLQPTTPFRSLSTVEDAVQVFDTTGRATIAVRPVPHAMVRGKPVRDVYAPTGSCYVISRAELERSGTFAPPGFKTVLDTSIGALDIDHIDEWMHAEAIAAGFTTGWVEEARTNRRFAAA